MTQQNTPKKPLEDYFKGKTQPFFKREEWDELNHFYPKDQVKKYFGEWIIREKFPFPKHMGFNDDEVARKFYQLRTLPLRELEFNKTGIEVNEKYDYRYPYQDHPLGLLECGHYYNLISNYFQYENRMWCGGRDKKAPMVYWTDPEMIQRMNWTFWRPKIFMPGLNLDSVQMHRSFQLGAYVAAQFKPPVAKYFYDIRKSKRVLDISCGWGDRLAGFYTSNADFYIGCDPNPKVYETYKKQCAFYDKLLSQGSTGTLTEYDDHFHYKGVKEVIIFNLPFEDIDWSPWYDSIDCIFSSPPYFDTERYAEKDEKVDLQSWKRYKKSDQWIKGFLHPVLDECEKLLRKDDGYLYLNIIDPRVHRKQIHICDDMVDYIKESYGGRLMFLGKYGMRMSTRPRMIRNSNISQDKSISRITLIEPVWTFARNNHEESSTYSFEEMFNTS